MSVSDDPALSRDDVAYLAGLARIDLTDAELDHLAPQLGVILDSVAVVGEVADADIPPMSHAVPTSNVFRADEVRPGLTHEEALSGAPQEEQQRFSVPRILTEEA
ncbi:MAG: Asp-tRNA(Asn)/Glu-tRNA(Gln) amidotransferase subunit GatC [Nocardioidaceae bacterium]|jgi:aspartyl-tRNA(Asn)/glutamyl-tRNA(Gln) amidotransferase subunit C|nr:Asp-tRNA(Asn)/Glu-tRNA(Gln) amidotransferase subunit GatC [Nocardioidaceae bacterium]